MTTNNELPNIDLSQLTCPECGAVAKHIITWAYNPHPQHGDSIGLAHSVGSRNSLQVEFECENGHIKFDTEFVPSPLGDA
jgi:hypothetical protein